MGRPVTSDIKQTIKHLKCTLNRLLNNFAKLVCCKIYVVEMASLICFLLISLRLLLIQISLNIQIILWCTAFYTLYRQIVPAEIAVRQRPCFRVEIRFHSI